MITYKKDIKLVKIDNEIDGPVLNGDWTKAVTELEVFFKDQNNLYPAKVKGVGDIIDPELFIKSHLRYVKNNDGKAYKIYLERLNYYKDYLEIKINEKKVSNPKTTQNE